MLYDLAWLLIHWKRLYIRNLREFMYRHWRQQFCIVATGYRKCPFIVMLKMCDLIISVVAVSSQSIACCVQVVDMRLIVIRFSSEMQSFSTLSLLGKPYHYVTCNTLICQ